MFVLVAAVAYVTGGAVRVLCECYGRAEYSIIHPNRWRYVCMGIHTITLFSTWRRAWHQFRIRSFSHLTNFYTVQFSIQWDSGSSSTMIYLSFYFNTNLETIQEQHRELVRLIFTVSLISIPKSFWLRWWKMAPCSLNKKYPSIVFCFLGTVVHGLVEYKL